MRALLGKSGVVDDPGFDRPVTLELRQARGHDPVAERLGAIAEVLEAHTITGSGDMLCRVVARSNADLQRVIDAIVASASRQPSSRQLVFTDLDCVWVAPEQLFARIPPADGVACIHIEYPPGWDVVGFGQAGRTRVEIGQLARGLGVTAGVPLWIGGELIAGSAESMLGVVAVDAYRCRARLLATPAGSPPAA